MGGRATKALSTVHVIGLPGSRRLVLLLIVQLGCLVGLTVLAVW